MTGRPTLAMWQWSVLAAFALAALALACTISERVSRSIDATSAGTAASRRVIPDAIVLPKSTRGGRVTRPRVASPIASPTTAPTAAPVVAPVAAPAPAPVAAHSPKALASSPVPLAPTPLAKSPASAPHASSTDPARATSAEMQEAASVLERARSESAL